MSGWGLFSSGSYSLVQNNQGKTDRRATLENFVRLTGGMATVVTGGEWRQHPEDGEENWLVPICRKIFKKLSLWPITANNGLKYWHYPVRKLLGFFLAPIIWMRAAFGSMPALPYAQWAAEDGPYIDAVRGNAHRMRGMPTAKALKLFSGLPLLGGFMERRVAEQARFILEADPETVISFELPAELAFVSVPFGKQKIARRMTKSLEKIIRQCPKGTRFAFHLCWGDLNHKPFVPKRAQSNRSKVALITELVLMKIWQEGWVLFAIHDPMCDGKNYPSEDAASYADYDDLPEFPQGVIYALGLLKAGFSTDRTVYVARMLQYKLEQKGITRFDLAPPCGDARTPEAHLENHWQIGREAVYILGTTEAF